MEFPRKPAQPLNADEEDLRFQVIDWFVPEADKAAWEIQRREGWQSFGDPDAEPPVYDIYMYGVTEKGDSVCAHVTDFQPYFYVRPPPKRVGMSSEELRGELLTKTKYNGRLKCECRIIPKRLAAHLEKVERVKRKDFWGFTNGKDFTFFKITVKSLALFNILSRYFKDRVEDGWKLYESNIDPFLRFVHERNIQPCGWVRLNASTYELIGDDGEKFARTSHVVRVRHTDVHAEDINKIAPLLITSFDLECTSSHGDFPVPCKDYRKLAMDLVNAARRTERAASTDDVWTWVLGAFKGHSITEQGADIHQVYTKAAKVTQKSVAPKLEPILEELTMLVQKIASSKGSSAAVGEDEEEGEAVPIGNAETMALENELVALLTTHLPKLKGDPIIQIGTTVHIYGSDQIVYRHIATLNSCDPIEGADVEAFDTEEELLLGWKDLIVRLDPDVLTGYNIFGFDMDYVWSRAKELGLLTGDGCDYGVGFGRLVERRTMLLEQRLSSSALGDNILKYVDLDGVVSIDMFKVMQRDHKLDSYKLDNVAGVFLGDHKEDLKPKQIFEKFGGSSADRRDIATYCLQDCALCNRLLHKLKVLENNVGMGNVCSVPLSYLFMRGQGVKIFSLVAKECKAKGYLIPVLKGFNPTMEDDTDGYEGAIVLEPKEGIYLEDPITVLDYSSLYPSSMIARNLSHDCFVNDEAYASMESEGISYLTVSYDVYEGAGDKKRCVGKKECTFAQLPNGQKGIIPSILQQLLGARKNTRKKIEYERVHLTDGRIALGLVTKEHDDGSLEMLNVDNADVCQGFGGCKATIPGDLIERREAAFSTFEQAVLDALQVAYKVTANSLYGQIGSRTSPIYWKDIAACTTATGREMIMTAKEFVEKRYGASVVYGDTDSIFIKFPISAPDQSERKLTGKDALPYAIAAGQRASREIKSILPPPQCLEYEKTLYPFILFSKKRYVGNLYEDDANKKPKQKSMGIVLKRRDNANIVKKVYGGIIDIILNKQDLNASVDFLREQLQDLVNGHVDIQDLVITKTLRAEYKDPTKIAHKVLADRMAARDPGNKPAANDRIPFVYIRPPPGVEVKLQGDRIEHPDFIKEHGITPDYRFYITNQLINPICQLYALCVEKLPDYTYSPGYWVQIEEELKEKEIYRDDKKRKDRLTALRMRQVEEILFEEYTSQLTEVCPAKKRATAKKKAAAASGEPLLPNPFAVTIRVADNKTTKRYDCEAVVRDGEATIHTTTMSIEKKRKTTTKQYCLRMTAEAVLTAVHMKPDVRSRGLSFQLDDKTFAREWRNAIVKADEIQAAIQEAIKNTDLGALNELQQQFVFENLINMGDTVPYQIAKNNSATKE